MPLITKSEDDRTEEKHDRGEWIECPHCQKEVLIRLKAKITGIGVSNENTTSPSEAKAARIVQAVSADTTVNTWGAALTGKQASVLAQAKRSGLFDSFVAALERAPHNGVPANKEKYFLDWLKLARSKVVPQWALAEFKGLYPGKFIEVVGANFVGAVLANGEMSLFFPIDLVSGVKVKTAMNGNMSMGAPDASGVRDWVRTKMGYVPQEARLMLLETRKRSLGEYANPVM